MSTLQGQKEEGITYVWGEKLTILLVHISK